MFLYISFALLHYHILLKFEQILVIRRILLFVYLLLIDYMLNDLLYAVSYMICLPSFTAHIKVLQCDSWKHKHENLSSLESDWAHGILCEADENSDSVTEKDLEFCDGVTQCLTEEFVLDDKPRQVFLNGDKLFVAKPAIEEVREQIGELEYVELAEERPVQALKTLGEWIQSGFPGYVKMWGAVVNSREVPLKERKVIGLIYEMTTDTLESYLNKNEDLRNDHKMYLAMTVFQAWHHTLHFGPCLSVFTMENIVVTRNEDNPSGSYNGYCAKLRLQFPTSSYEKAMCIETLDTNVEQLADVSLGRVSGGQMQ